MKQHRWGPLILLTLAVGAGLCWLLSVDSAIEPTDPEPGLWPRESLAIHLEQDDEESHLRSKPESESVARLSMFQEGEGFASLIGRVLSHSTHKGIAQARIQILQPSIGLLAKGGVPRTLKVAETNTSGAWSCDRLEELANIMLKIHADGYKDSVYRVQLGQGQLALGDLYLDELGATVRVLARDAEGRPIPQVRVRPRRVQDSTTSSVGNRLVLNHKSPWVTDAEGQVLIPMESGFHRFELMAKEYVPLISEVLEVPKTGLVEFSCELQTGAPLRVRVENARGEAVPGAIVDLCWARSPWPCALWSDKEGIVEFSSAPLDCTLDLSTTSNYSSAKKRHLESHPRKLVRMVLDEEYKATIRLTLHDEAAVGKTGPVLVILAQSDKSGLRQIDRFLFDEPSGTHEIPVKVLGKHSGVARFQLLAMSSGRYARSRWLQLEAGMTQPCRLVFREDSSCQIAIRVLSASRNPIPNAWVRLYIPTHSKAWPGHSITDAVKPMFAIVLGRSYGTHQALRGSRTNLKGELVLYGLPDLDMRLLVEHPEHGLVIRSVPASKAGTKLVYEVVLAETGAVHGRVLGDIPLPTGAYVHMEDEDGIVAVTAVVSDTGDYEITGLPEGTYSLEVRSIATRGVQEMTARLRVWSARAMSSDPLASLSNRVQIHLGKNCRVRVDLRWRNEVDERSRVVRFEIRGLSASRRHLLEAIPLNQDFERMFGPTSFRTVLSPEGRISTRLLKGSYLVRVTGERQPPELLVWKRIRVEATGNAEPQVVRLSCGLARLTLSGLSTWTTGAMRLRLIPELGSGANLRRYGMEIEVIDAMQVQVDGVPHGIYRVELVVRGKKKPLLLPGSVRVHGRETTKRY